MTFLDARPRMTRLGLEHRVVEAAERHGWHVWPGPPSSDALDLLLIKRPRLLWIKLMADRGRLTPSQRRPVIDLRAWGQTVYVWRPRDAENGTIERTLSR